MNRKILSLILLFTISVFYGFATDRIVGGDLSLVPAYEYSGDKWLDEKGQTISDLISYVQSQGWNVVRVRLFVDPNQEKSDPAVCQDLEYVTKLGARVKAAGMCFMLDFHYSDTWADPGRQKIPFSWLEETGAKALAKNVYNYTQFVIESLIQHNATPNYVQLGNEITYGLLWNTSDGHYPANSSSYAQAGYCTTWSATYSSGSAQWLRTARLLNNAAQAVHETFDKQGLDSTQVKLIVHTELGGAATNKDNFYRHIRTAGFDNYDIIGLSYYPFWHGKLSDLGTILDIYAADFPEKQVQIVETAWYNNYYPYSSDGKNEYSIASLNSKWTANAAGMVNYLNDLVAFLDSRTQVTGLVYWEPEECGNGYTSTRPVANGWLNRGMWVNSSSQRHSIYKNSAGVTPVQALAKYVRGTNGINDVEVGTQDPSSKGFYDLQGRVVSHPHQGIYIKDDRKVLVK